MEYMRGMAKYVSPSRLFQRSPKPSQEGIGPAVEGEQSDGRPVSAAVPAVVSVAPDPPSNGEVGAASVPTTATPDATGMSHELQLETVPTAAELSDRGTSRSRSRTKRKSIGSMPAIKTPSPVEASGKARAQGRPASEPSEPGSDQFSESDVDMAARRDKAKRDLNVARKGIAKVKQQAAESSESNAAAQRALKDYKEVKAAKDDALDTQVAELGAVREEGVRLADALIERRRLEEQEARAELEARLPPGSSAADRADLHELLLDSAVAHFEQQLDKTSRHSDQQFARLFEEFGVLRQKVDGEQEEAHPAGRMPESGAASEMEHGDESESLGEGYRMTSEVDDDPESPANYVEYLAKEAMWIRHMSFRDFEKKYNDIGTKIVRRKVFGVGGSLDGKARYGDSMVKGKLVFLGEVPEYTPWLKEILLLFHCQHHLSPHLGRRVNLLGHHRQFMNYVIAGEHQEDFDAKYAARGWAGMRMLPFDKLGKPLPLAKVNPYVKDGPERC